ncbi:hypothetical protein DSL72_002632 [Monilinia vaccinii-corymbosi]|uniref:Uncharacterized protein n=1 Tax=Monilinia vaccinii-corymbosi TaxID=61207 RepID=A0A8A3PD21_9HELO|nr:hypothetical protein DSL72_002632 [Monilinia vaccinii-corymbosi]
MSDYSLALTQDDSPEIYKAISPISLYRSYPAEE